MIKVRKNVFETNSSSTHSITIEDSEHRNFEYVDIPKNKKIIIDDLDFNKYNNNETEWTKLNALIDFVVGFYSDDDVDTNKPLFEIIKKVIKDKCDSNLELNLPEYYEYIFDDYDENSLRLLGLSDDSTEDEMYNRFKEIIFNPKINFKHKDSEY